MPKALPRLDVFGAFFTPVAWCEWVCENFGVYDEWIAGKTVFDPTAGAGNFLEALISLATKRQVALSPSLLSRLYANEREQAFRTDFFRRMKIAYSIDFPQQNFTAYDFLTTPVPIKADILVGNPPWKTLGSLPEEDKGPAKRQFLSYGMVRSAKDVLLGNSRLDISTLIATKAIVENATPHAHAHFFLPLSLICGAGAYINLYSWESRGVSFGPTRVDGMTEMDIFGGVQTRYGLVSLKRDIKPSFPIKFVRHAPDRCNLMVLDKLYGGEHSGPFLVGHSVEEIKEFRELLGALNLKDTEPARQGANTCGANDILVFDTKKEQKNGLLLLTNKHISVEVEPDFVCTFHHTKSPKTRYILIPHNQTTGKPLTMEELTQYPKLWGYLQQNEQALVSRKGIMIQSLIKRGFWWALLGVGAYSFAPYKVIWQAYGTDDLSPEVVGKNVQGNQAMHGFIPCKTEQEAQKLAQTLRHFLFWRYLKMSSLPGSKSWAQPGKIMEVLRAAGSECLVVRKKKTAR